MERQYLPADQLLAMIKDAITKDPLLAQLCGDWRPDGVVRAHGASDWQLHDLSAAPSAAQGELRKACAQLAVHYGVDWSTDRPSPAP